MTLQLRAPGPGATAAQRAASLYRAAQAEAATVAREGLDSSEAAAIQLSDMAMLTLLPPGVREEARRLSADIKSRVESMALLLARSQP